jgi:hypothetical protein
MKYITIKIYRHTLPKWRLLAALRGQAVCQLQDELVTLELAKEAVLESGK